MQGSVSIRRKPYRKCCAMRPGHNYCGYGMRRGRCSVNCSTRSTPLTSSRCGRKVWHLMNICAPDAQNERGANQLGSQRRHATTRVQQGPCGRRRTRSDHAFRSLPPAAGPGPAGRRDHREWDRSTGGGERSRGHFPGRRLRRPPSRGPAAGHLAEGGRRTRLWLRRRRSAVVLPHHRADRPRESFDGALLSGALQRDADPARVRYRCAGAAIHPADDRAVACCWSEPARSRVGGGIPARR